jgi:hypothetical protein
MIISDCIFCDDIRQEIGSKISLMGIFGNNVTVTVSADHEGDAPLKIAMLLRVLVEEGDTVPDHFVLSLAHEGVEVAKSESKLDDSIIPEMIVIPLRFTQALAIHKNGLLKTTVVFSKNGEIFFTGSPSFDLKVTVVKPTPKEKKDLKTPVLSPLTKPH